MEEQKKLFEKRKPRIEMKFKVSKSGRHIIAEESSSWIFPINYMIKIIEAAKTRGENVSKN